VTAFHFDNTYARDLPGFYTSWPPARVPAPQLLYFNDALALELGLDASALRSPAGGDIFAGNVVPAGAEPLAQAYAGHQFGGFSPRLGDGRALLLGEVLDTQGRRRDIAFKGSGRTPFSRGGDGKAAVGPMLREVLLGEAMHALGIPSTRALAVAATGERVMRDGPLPGAVLTRVAASHLRVGTFQFFLAEGDAPKLRQLLDYAIARHDPALAGMPGREMAFLRAVAQRQATLIAQWLNVGFIHGVMNTDNMTISGETIDYGPCAFMEAYDPATVFSSIDHGGRYAYGRQAAIARWNLARLAETLLPLLADADDEPAAQQAVAVATEVIDAFPAMVARALLAGQRAKLGLLAPAHTWTAADDEEDSRLVEAWLALLQSQAVDFTLAWRLLAMAADEAEPGAAEPLRDQFRDRAVLDAWMATWRARLEREAAAGGPAGAARVAVMRRTNPRIIPRNHQVEAALAAATAGDLAPFDALLAALRQPYSDDPALAKYAEPAPAAQTAAYQTFCGT
jgi:serine/tyrosine/threonine adenylyltransferase